MLMNAPTCLPSWATRKELTGTGLTAILHKVLFLQFTTLLWVHSHDIQIISCLILTDSFRVPPKIRRYNSCEYYRCNRKLFKPTSCVVRYRCGAYAPGWLNSAHPSVADGIVHATAGFNYYYGCCSWTKSIRVRNCGGFYVYELGPPPVCNARYCGNGRGKDKTIVRRTDILFYN